MCSPSPAGCMGARLAGTLFVTDRQVYHTFCFFRLLLTFIDTIGAFARIGHNRKQLLTTDLLALATMKNAAKCDT
jgi:hypothetical protein